MTDELPPEVFLAAYPDPIAAIGEELRAVVFRAIPDAIERVRPGWRLIGYNVPAGRRRTVYFAYIAPEPEHIHLGFEQGAAMRDPERRLTGEGITRQVRWVTFEPGDTVDDAALVALIREAARVATLSRAERLAEALAEDDIAPLDK